MKVPILFQVIQDRKKKLRKIILDCPDFIEIPEIEFKGKIFPKTSIEEQIMEWLDNLDKFPIMVENDWEIIIDYKIWKKKEKKNEILDFVNYIQPYLTSMPYLVRPFEAIISECKDILFGKGKSNNTKALEILSIIRVSELVASSTLTMVENMFNKDKDKLLNY